MINELVLKTEERAVINLRSLYTAYGYRPFKMSKFEEYDFYVQNKDFLVSDRVITFTDTDGKLLALKPDVTLSIIRSTKDAPGEKQKLYYDEKVFRVGVTGGQFKEIMQTGLECIGDLDSVDVFEAVLLALKSLKFVSNDFVLDISHMGIISSVLEAASSSVAFRQKVLSLIAEKNTRGVELACREFNISEELTFDIVRLASLYGCIEQVLPELALICKSKCANKAYNELYELCQELSKTEHSKNIRIDFSVVNNMKYYDGIVFRGFLSGIPNGVLAGGEYTGLLEGMGRRSRAVGFALYLDQLCELEKIPAPYDVDVLLIYSDSDSLSDVQYKKQLIVARGKSVFASKNIPSGLRYREAVRMEDCDD